MKRKMKLDETAEKVLRLELAYGVHLYKKSGLLVGTFTWETEYKGTVIHADDLDKMEEALQAMKGKEETGC